jgi:hypothetical protein
MDYQQSLFSILPEFEEEYNKNIEIGGEFLSNKKIAILGLVRDVDSVLGHNIKYINQLSSMCERVSYFIYENDSIDNTVVVLKEINKNITNFHYISEQLSLKKYGQVKTKNRVTNLAKHRNLCLEYAKNNFQETDFIIVLDLDFRWANIEGILNSFGLISKTNQIDGMAGFSFEIKPNPFSPQKNMLWNYDSWAYRGNWWDDLHKHINKYNGLDPMIWFGFWQPVIGSCPIQVNSAFGGCCIYKTNKFLIGKYEDYDCEHVCFHKYLAERCSFKLFVNPSQIMLFA